MGFVALGGVLLGAGSAGTTGESHYQDVLVGERAAGMGGAFTALANEASGAYYNPAGIVAESSTVIQLSMSAYQLRLKRAEVGDLCGTKLTEDEGGFHGFPASFGFVKRFHSSGVDHGVGLTVAIPHASKVGQSFKQTDKQCGQIKFDLGGSNLVVDRAFWGGLTYAVRPWRFLQAGVTLGISLRSATYTGLSMQLWEVPNTPLLPYVSFVNADVGLWSLFAQIGVIVTPPVDGLRLGLSFTTPYLRVAGTGRLDVLEAQADPNLWDQSGVLALDDAEFHWKVPFKLSLGASYTLHHWLTLALDAKLHGGVERYSVFTHPSLPASLENKVARDLVVNVNLGAEAHLGHSIVLRLGAFTNLSSVPSDLPDVDDERINYFGASLGAAYLASDNSSMGFVVQGQYGRGTTVGFQLDAQGNVTEPRVDVSDLVLIFSIGGSYDLR